MPCICNVGAVRPQPCFICASRNVVTTGNGMGTKNVLKWNRALRFVFSIQSSMGRRLRQNATNVSEIYIGRPIYISDVHIQYPTSARARARATARARAGISDVRYRYRTSDIYIGRSIYILEVRYIYSSKSHDSLLETFLVYALFQAISI